MRFLVVGAHDAHAGERLLHDRAEVGELRLNRLEARVDRAAEVLHADRHERQRQQRNQGQPAVDRRHQDDRHDEDDDRCSPSTSPPGRSSCGRRSGRWSRATSGRRCAAPGSTRAASAAAGRRRRCACRTRSRREAPMRMRRIRKRNTPPTTAMASSSAGVHRQLPARDAGVEIVDRVLEHPGRQQLNGRRRDDAGQAEEKGSLVPKKVREQSGKERASSLSISRVDVYGSEVHSLSRFNCSAFASCEVRRVGVLSGRAAMRLTGAA